MPWRCSESSRSPSHADTVVTFDDLPDGTVPDGYGGINWGGVWTAYSEPQYPYTPESSPSRVYTPQTGAGEYTFSFVTPGQVFDGAYFAGNSSATVYFDLYYNSSLVWTSASLDPSDTPTYLASGYSGPVDTVGVYSASNDFYVMDNVTYGTASVPEPSSVCSWAWELRESSLSRLVGHGAVLTNVRNGALNRRVVRWSRTWFFPTGEIETRPIMAALFYPSGYTRRASGRFKPW